MNAIVFHAKKNKVKLLVHVGSIVHGIKQRQLGVQWVLMSIKEGACWGTLGDFCSLKQKVEQCPYKWDNTFSKHQTYSL